MSTGHRMVALVLLASLLVTSCSSAEPTAAPVPPTAPQIALGATDTPLPSTATPALPTAVATRSPVPLAATAEPPTATASLTPTDIPPTEEPTLPPEPAPGQRSIDDILSGLEDLPIDEFLAESWRQLQLRDPDILFANGFADVYGVVPADQFTDLSADYLGDTERLEREILALLRTYERTALSADQGISYDSLDWYLTMQVRGQAFADYRFLVNPVWGLQNWPIDFLMESPLEKKEDAEHYVARLASLDTWADQVIAGLERNEQAGALPPRYVLEATIDQLDAILAQDPAQTGFYADFSNRVYRINDLDQDERDDLRSAVLAEVEETVLPAYRSLRNRLSALATVAIQDPNEWTLPGGEEYYAYLLEYYTATTLSADEIHELGLAEVARIQVEIRDAAAALGYPAQITMAELNQRLAEESQIITGSALRQEYERLLAAADQAAEAAFGRRASADVVLRTDPDGPPAYYASPPPGSDGPGEMRVNLDVSPRYVNYDEHVLVHHETIPGHHTQLALAQELDLPGYQRFYRVNPYLQDYAFEAYPEGWALYAEILASEMGLYDGDPLANLWRLRLRLLRTVRLVADTGLHARGWTLDEAAAYLEETTGMSQSRAGLMRYLVNPGYTCGYNVGGLKILEMRQRAREKLGDRFDIKEFHDTVLGHGVVPIEVLDKIVDGWIEAQAGGGELRITILYDNTPYDSRLLQAWGFAALVEYRGHTLLFDTGGDPDILMHNVDLLGIDPASIEAIVLSHNHADHVGGLPGLAQRGIQVPVYILPSFPSSFKNYLGRQFDLIAVTPGQELSDGISTTGAMLNPDLGIYEQSLVISTSRGLVVVTGCAHPGIVEIVEQAEEMFDAPLRLVLGGMHLVDKSTGEIQAIIGDLRRLGVEQVGPTHCTGEAGISMFAQAYGDDFLQAGVGRIVVVEQGAAATRPSAQASLGDTWIRPADEMAMVYVPAGSFSMGSDEDEIDLALELCETYYQAACERSWFEVEAPPHTVTLDGFWLDRTEVTNAQYRRCVETGTCAPPRRSDSGTRATYYEDGAYDDYPVIHVTWGQADAYCRWAGGRLPTEAEWEYAARGPEGRRYPWGEDYDGARLNSCDVNCGYEWAEEAFDDGYGDTAPVGSYPGGASWCGALDLAGNVWEWTGDWFSAYLSGPQSNPARPASGTDRALRGDAADGTRAVSRAAARHGMRPGRDYEYTGFRCAAPAQEPE